MYQSLWSSAAGWNVPVPFHWEKGITSFCPWWAKPEWAKLPLTVLMLQEMEQMKKSLLQLLGYHQTFLLCEVQSCCYQLDCATVLLLCPDWKHACRKGCSKHRAICRVSARSSVIVVLIFGDNWGRVGALQNPPASVPWRCEEKCEVLLLLSLDTQYLHFIMQYMHLSKSCWCGMEDLMESFFLRNFCLDSRLTGCHQHSTKLSASLIFLYT